MAHEIFNNVNSFILVEPEVDLLAMILSDISYKVTKDNIGKLRSWLKEESSKVDAELQYQKLCKEFDKEPRCFISTFEITEKKVVFVTFRGTATTQEFWKNFKLTVPNYF